MSFHRSTQEQGGTRLLTTSQAADYLGLSVSTLCRWRSEGTGPRYTVLGRSAVRYTQASLEKFAAAGVRQSTSERAA